MKKKDAREVLLNRLRVNGCTVTPLIEDEYSQMTIQECRAHARACVRAVSVVPRTVAQAIRAGFRSTGADFQIRPDEKVAVGTTSFSRELGHGVNQRLVATTVARFTHTGLRKPRSRFEKAV